MDKSIVPVNQQIAVRSSTCYEFSNRNEAEVVEVEDNPLEVVEKQMEELKLNHQFSEKDVPKVFQDLMKDKMSSLKKIELNVFDEYCTLILDEIGVDLMNKGSVWLIDYNMINNATRVDDPEKSIIDHLWFVLKNPNIKLSSFRIQVFINLKPESNPKIDFEKLNTLLQSMIASIDHKFHMNSFGCERINEDMFLSMLKHVDPRTLDIISFLLSWKEKGNYQKMKEIVETEQWKQAKRIYSRGDTSLAINDLFHCEHCSLGLASVTPEDVLRVIEHAFNSPVSGWFALCARDSNLKDEAIINFLRSQTDGAEITRVRPFDHDAKFCYKIEKSGKSVLLVGNQKLITIMIN